KLEQMIEDQIIQIAPLGFMRGRTLSNAFVILDEAQNATFNQMKMFLTRMGEYSKFIITGDITQIDLPDKSQSGLLKASEILKNIDGIKFIHFDAGDVIRHKLVSSIIKAYEKDKNTNK
ncbi:MAG: PhoH family protein, partial [Bacteroidales bacterium]|nr:PhoH family protein [Bacteroidales bacterium]